MPRAIRKKPSLSFITQIANKILKINIVYLLGSLLIVASFLIGVLVTKVSYLEKTGGTTVSGTDSSLDSGQPQRPAGPVDVSQGHLPILGKSDAKVKIIEFSDFQCPFCKTLFDESFAQIKKDFIDTGKAKFAYRHFPLSFHANAQKAAEASECANEQGNFWGYHDELFKNQTSWESLSEDQALDKFAEYANTVGLNRESLKTCLSSGKMADKVKEDTNAGVAAGVDGTPATFINGYLVSGAQPYSAFKSEIENRLAE